jgi:hypothetical protein
MPFTVYHGYHLEWDDDVRRVRVLRKTDGKFVTYGLEHHTPEQAMEGARKLVDEFPDRKDVAWLSGREWPYLKVKARALRAKE